jgi:glucuronate isomerase
MTLFPDENFLLRSELARQLYHEHAAGLPVIDFHSHLDAGDLAADRRFRDLTQLWIEPDQYKHRALRMLGVPEREITGDAPPRAKFDRWAAAVPQTPGHPLYHWTALELRRYFGVTVALGPESAGAVWADTLAQLAQPSHRARALLERSGVETVCTSDRLLDDLAAHRALASSAFTVRVLPSLRADDALAVDSPDFGTWLRRLGEATGGAIASLEAYLAAIDRRLDHFAAHGCTISDHGLDVFDYVAPDRAAAAVSFRRLLAGESLGPGESRGLRSALLLHFAGAYGRRGWVMQLHLGAQRDTSSRLRRLAGRAGGFATIGAPTDIASLCRFLDDLEVGGALPKTILYPLNPADHPPIAALTGSFAQDGVAGKVQFGPAWWFNDHDLGLRHHFDTVSRFGLLSTFVGMTTDSRSLLSMSRHEYFRRILCDYLGEQVRAGAFPDDSALLGQLVRRLAYENARTWLPQPAGAPLP